jgi:mannan endo-1,4-beta-mannosidase
MWINRIFVSLVVLFSVCLSSWGGQNENRHSPEAESLLQCLRQIWGKQIISGTMATVNWNINEAEWVHQHTGKWPVLNCFDYIHHPFSSKGGWIDYTDIAEVCDWHRSGGLVSIMWHWNVPANQDGKYSFYWGTEPEKTTFDVRKIFEPSSPEYQLMIRDIDTIASYLKHIMKGVLRT